MSFLNSNCDSCHKDFQSSSVRKPPWDGNSMKFPFHVEPSSTITDLVQHLTIKSALSRDRSFEGIAGLVNINVLKFRILMSSFDLWGCGMQQFHAISKLENQPAPPNWNWLAIAFNFPRTVNWCQLYDIAEIWEFKKNPSAVIAMFTKTCSQIGKPIDPEENAHEMTQRDQKPWIW